MCPDLKPPQTVWCIVVREVTRGSVQWSAETLQVPPADPKGLKFCVPLRPDAPQLARDTQLEGEGQIPHPGRTTCLMGRLQGGAGSH